MKRIKEVLKKRKIMKELKEKCCFDGCNKKAHIKAVVFIKGEYKEVNYCLNHEYMVDYFNDIEKNG